MQFYSSGKILVTGEYVVLNGAKAFALPTVFGQYLQVLPTNNNYFQWISINVDQTIWFNAKFSINSLKIIETNNIENAKVLQKLLQIIKKYKPQLFTSSLQFTTNLNFDKDWGLGSSSTFIANLSKWSEVDAFTLSNISLGGSGYDIAVAIEQKPLLFHLTNQQAKWQKVDFTPAFTDQLWFVYLNRKQNSREGIKQYQKNKATQTEIKEISLISTQIAVCQDYSQFCRLLNRHENIMSKILQRPTIKQQIFPDFKGTVKSLGAWGGDFILATGNQIENYFLDKGYTNILSYQDFIASNQKSSEQ